MNDNDLRHLLQAYIAPDTPANLRQKLQNKIVGAEAQIKITAPPFWTWSMTGWTLSVGLSLAVWLGYWLGQQGGSLLVDAGEVTRGLL